MLIQSLFSSVSVLRGSIPSNGLVVQLVRTPPCHGGGRGFESHPGRQGRREAFVREFPRASCEARLRIRGIRDLHQDFMLYVWCGVIAQLGEHLPYKQGVTGSSPVGPIFGN